MQRMRDATRRRKEKAKGKEELQRVWAEMQQRRQSGSSSGLTAAADSQQADAQPLHRIDAQHRDGKRILSVPSPASPPAASSPAATASPSAAASARAAAAPSSSPSVSPSPSPSLASPRFQLYHEQLQLESLALDEAVHDYAAVTETLVGMRMGAQLRPAQRMMLQWYSPLVAAIEKEQERARRLQQQAGTRLAAAEAHLPYLLHLSAPQLAVLTMHTTFSLALACQGQRLQHSDGEEDAVTGVKFSLASAEVGQTVNMEVKMQSMRKDRHKMRQFLASIVGLDGHHAHAAAGAGGAAKGAGGAADGSAGLSVSPNVLSKLRTSRRNSWSAEVCVKLGAALLQLLLSTAAVPELPRGQFVPAFSHEVVWDSSSASSSSASRPRKLVGLITTDERVLSVVLRDHSATEAMMPKLKPMIVPPRPWSSYDDGGYLSVGSKVMRSHGSLMQMAAVSRSELTAVYRALNFLSQTPWRINSRLLDVMEKLWERGGGVAKLPSTSDVPLPPPLPPADSESVAPSGSGRRRSFSRDHSAAVRHNRNLHSLRCDVNLKLSVARQFKGRVIYFPFNLDFRGRAYPIPPHLNHIGNDMCRGLLLFEERRRLGEAGLRWLRIHAANVWGHGKEKLPFSEREQWAADSLQLITRSATQPLDGPASASSPWWLEAEKPFQFLSVCMELHAALSSPSPADFMSALPVHQDGSCNGLQHYAALGRDEEGGAAVNLTPSDRPQDVYAVVCQRVLQRVREDAAAGLPLAQLLDGKVTRKIVKQTVMTSVYGVTLIGAREQIRSRLLETSSIAFPEPVDASVRQAALYLARLTLASLYSAFAGARRIQDWLSDCAARMAALQQPVAWTTPLGLPVIQPYRKSAAYSVQTIMQQVSLADHSDLLPVASARQRSALPPNFIHSLDATHMLMTALRCQQQGMTFTAVHDSYWTHAGQMDELSRLLREEFVSLYQQPILQTTRDDWQRRFPELRLEPVPATGTLQLQQVLDSPYFFN